MDEERVELAAGTQFVSPLPLKSPVTTLPSTYPTYSHYFYQYQCQVPVPVSEYQYQYPGLIKVLELRNDIPSRARAW